MTREEIVNAIKPILAQYPVEKASFFGSYAKGNHTPISDVDILVEFEIQKVGLMFFSLREDLATVLPMPFDLIYKPGLQRMDSAFQNDIQKDELVFYEKNFAASN